MFKLTQSPTFWTAVDAEMTAEDGTKQRIKFDVQCKRMPIDDVIELQRRVRDDGGGDAALCREVVVDWRNVGDAAGEPLPFTPENFDNLLSFGLAAPIGFAFMAGYPRAKLKN